MRVQTNVAISDSDWPSNHRTSTVSVFLDVPCFLRYHQGVLKASTFHTGFVPLLFCSSSSRPIPSFVFCNDCHSPQASSLSLQGSPPLRHAQLHVHALSNSRSNSLCPVTVSFARRHYSGFVFAGRVTSVSASGLRLLFMHNFRRPFFPQFDIPEKYDLARKISVRH